MKTDKYLQCPACNKKTLESKWKEDSEECELCGMMTGIQCPRFLCGAVFTDCSWEYPKEVLE